ncbi:MAG: sensor histidine kinase [Clostridiaceae bacterium]|nr:sensor histidine kinase [Clostridiaceae bacterium]
MKEIALHILDIMQNSVAAGAGRIGVSITADDDTGMLTAVIDDDGCGMDEKMLREVTDPFTTTRTTRKVGLGIPLLRSSCIMSGGSFDITSQKGCGTRVTAVFGKDHIDRPVLGDLAGVIADMSAAFPEIDIRLELKHRDKCFTYSSADAGRILGEVPVSEPAVVKWLKEYIDEGVKHIFGGVLNEIVG